jgi:hypothetical protein
VNDISYDDSLGRMVLGAFNHYSVKIGDWLLEQNITAFAWNHGQTTFEAQVGLLFAMQRKWIEQAPSGALVLMRDGIAGMAAYLKAASQNPCEYPVAHDATPLCEEEMAIISRVYDSIGKESWFAHSFPNDWQFSALVMQAFLEGRRTEPHLREYCSRIAKQKYGTPN